jgi:uncharacterized protein (DUF433 family)
MVAMTTTIIDRGRGPEIEGTRITVYDVLDYRKHGWHRDRIAAMFRLSSQDVQAAFDYIDQHKVEVMESYQKILQRHRDYEYPPEVQAKIDQCRGVAQARLAEIRSQRRQEVQHADDHG